MYYKSIADLNLTILTHTHLIPGDTDLIVGIPRSGMIPAVLIAQTLHLPYTDIHSFVSGRIYGPNNTVQQITSDLFKNILIVDDSVASGSALREAQKMVRELDSNFRIKYCSIYVVPAKAKKTDIFFETLALPQVYQWNVFHHSILEKSCLDIDGVLCPDPTLKQDDDGPLYLDFIKNAPPLYIPGCTIGTIVTSRKEKYRKETKEWLSKHNIRYKQLIMFDSDKGKLTYVRTPVKLKAQVYKSLNYLLFIESSLYDARRINKLTGKPVLCTENFEMISETESLLHNIRSGKYLPRTRQILLRIRKKLKGR